MNFPPGPQLYERLVPSVRTHRAPQDIALVSSLNNHAHILEILRERLIIRRHVTIALTVHM